MNKEIIKMAQKAHLVMYDYEHPSLERFAALVAAAEREACAKEADAWTNNCVWEARTAAANIANSIRKRGQA